MGSGSFAVPILSALSESGLFSIAAVVSRPEAPAGRGRRARKSPVASAAEDLGLPLLQEAKLGRSARAELERLAPSVAVSADFGLWIPPWLLSLPAHGVVNVHPSLLPRLRGAAPVARAILEGDPLTGVSFMLTDEGWDTGPVLERMETPVREGETAGELEERLSRMAAGALPDLLRRHVLGQIVPVPQEGEPSLAPRLTPSEALIDWGEPALRLARLILAMNPEPCARTVFRGKSLRVLRASRSDAPSAPGVISRPSATRMLVGCGDGSLEVLELQPESRKIMSGMAFCAGYSPAEGERLG
jgi:methionyl-tRNA formyltransferase